MSDKRASRLRGSIVGASDAPQRSMELMRDDEDCAVFHHRPPKLPLALCGTCGGQTRSP